MFATFLGHIPHSNRIKPTNYLILAMLCKFPAATKRLCYHLTQQHMFSEACMVYASHATLSKCYQWKLHALFYELEIVQTFLYGVWLKYAKGPLRYVLVHCAERLNRIPSACRGCFFVHFSPSCPHRHFHFDDNIHVSLDIQLGLCFNW